MHKNENRPGYKKTKVGWIPEDWKLFCLGDFTKWSSGGTPSKAREDFWNGDIPWISAVSMRGTRFCDSERRITRAGLESGSRLAPKNSLLLLVRGSMLFKKIPVGIAAKDVAFNQDVKSIMPEETIASSAYLLCWLLGSEQRIRAMVGGTGIGAGKLDTSELQAMSIPLPFLPEQKTIANVLECWDKAIRGYEKKIEKKRNIKKGLMQRLLSGKQRLFGFEGGWKEVRLGEVCLLQNGYAFKSDTYDANGKYKVITIANVQDGAMSLTAVSAISVAPSDLRPHQYLRKGDILLSMTGNVGRVCIVTHDNCLLNQRVGKLQPKQGVTKDFIYYIVHNRHFLQRMIAIAQGGAQDNLSAKDIVKYKFMIPASGEQHAIASVLTEADAEIVALERKLVVLKDQKRFLLNNMVTGTIRLSQFAGESRLTCTNGDTE